MVHGNVVDQFHDHHSLADTGTTKQTNLTTLCIRGQQVDHLRGGGGGGVINYLILVKGGGRGGDVFTLIPVTRIS